MIYVTELAQYTTDQVRPFLRKHGRRWALLWSDVGHVELGDFARRISLSTHFLIPHERATRQCYWLTPEWRERAVKGGALEGTLALRQRHMRAELEQMSAEKEARKQAQREQGSKGGTVNPPPEVLPLTPLELLRNALPDEIVRSYPLGPEGDRVLQSYLAIWPETERAAHFIARRYERVRKFGERGASHEASDGPPGERYCLKCRLKEPWWDQLYCWSAAAFAREAERTRGETRADDDATGDGADRSRGAARNLPSRGARPVVRA